MTATAEPRSAREGERALLESLISGVVNDLFESPARNVDPWRFELGPTGRVKRGVRERLLRAAGRLRLARKTRDAEGISRRLTDVVEQLPSLYDVSESLSDEASRELLVELLRFRILGSRHVKLSRNSDAFWEARERVEQLQLPGQPVRSSGWKLHRYRLGQDYDSLELYAHPLAILNTFVLEQYAYRKDGALVQAAPGDVVIDGGSCHGDTALYFASLVGPTGRVLGFELAPDNLSVLRENLTRNPALAERITIAEEALWKTSDETLSFELAGPSTHLTDGENGGETARTVAIDDLVERERLESVDFIKLDIEGAELDALRGAERTIHAFHPQLAVAVYHDDEELTRIAAFLKQFDPGYELFLDHFTIFAEETVLFARAAKAA
jgi:FkbM family methyltransferase